jgi:hypothetical protein
MSNRIALVKDEKTGDALIAALVKAYPGKLCVLGELPGDRVELYTAPGSGINEARSGLVGIVHVLAAGGGMTFVGKLQEFARGYLAAMDAAAAVGETQGYEPDKTPMSVSPDWKSDGTGFRDDDSLTDHKGDPLYPASGRR